MLGPPEAWRVLRKTLKERKSAASQELLTDCSACAEPKDCGRYLSCPVGSRSLAAGLLEEQPFVELLMVGLDCVLEAPPARQQHGNTAVLLVVRVHPVVHRGGSCHYN